MTKFKVRLGEDWDLSSVDVDHVQDVKTVSKAAVAQREAKVRQLLAVGSMVALGVALAVSSWFDFQRGSFSEVSAVWNAGAFPLGFILRGYFGKG